MKHTLVLLLLLFSLQIGFAQRPTDAEFKKYVVTEIFSGKNAPINYKSSSTARSFRTLLSRNYKNSKVNFAGHYVAVTWSVGTGGRDGAMIDAINGNVYDLPVDEEVAYQGEAYYKLSSSLFVTESCTNIDGTDCTKYKNFWDEKIKI